MCTASWLTSEAGFELFFNRDERRTRGVALPPRLQSEHGVRFLAPTDADAGGTWIGVNEHGLALGLLNAWHVAAPAGGEAVRSRGLLLRDLLSLPDVDGVRAALEDEPLARYRGFSLAAFEPGAAPQVFRWDGHGLQGLPARAPLSSSSLDAEGARVARERLYAALGARVDAGALAAFHRSHAPERGPFSPCMHRADAATVSSTHVVVDAGSVTLRYAGGPPCRHDYGAPLVLARRTPCDSTPG